eukprot:TRINITY_DN774320_c0_g1_i1.p1 TRINITY_DN774320_c0_g1~~TRINITY_DN774320_c0_g1_i1.p1  ORF type:complete len:202 (-),score=61.82 TRINITY_DN774320_c0_g1_i1:121-726(-)
MHPVALIFDCDGTLVNSMPKYWITWDAVCTEKGIDFPMERFLAMAGCSIDRIFEILIEEQGLDYTVQELVAAKRKSAADLSKTWKIEAVDCVIDIVKEWHGKVPLAVASSGWKDHVLDNLKELDLMKYFDVVVTCEDVQNPKPAPDLFLEAARQLGVDPKKCRGFEDADLGMQSLESAGMEAVDVRKIEGYPHMTPPKKEE